MKNCKNVKNHAKFFFGNFWKIVKFTFVQDTHLAKNGQKMDNFQEFQFFKKTRKIEVFEPKFPVFSHFSKKSKFYKIFTENFRGSAKVKRRSSGGLAGWTPYFSLKIVFFLFKNLDFYPPKMTPQK